MKILHNTVPATPTVPAASSPRGAGTPHRTRGVSPRGVGTPRGAGTSPTDPLASATRRVRRGYGVCRGFTLLELMVASLLLAMLMSAVTMIFNQSSIAWRTGVSSVVELGDARSNIGEYQEVVDDIVPGLNGESDVGTRTVSVWTRSDALRNRPLYTAACTQPVPGCEELKKGAATPVRGAGQGQSSSLYIVGVRSLGKDGKPETADDITTWPEGID